jgi:hypothetical protein
VNRRMTSRKVVLTAAFLALAAGGAAACDAPADEGNEGDTTTSVYDAGSSPAGGGSGTRSEPEADTDDDESDADQPTDEVFYCADDEGQIVDEDYCDDDSGESSYFLWHSSGYPRGLRTGTYLDGGDYISTSDRTARRALKLPATGKVTNGTVKTNVVGRSSTNSGSTGGGSDSGTDSLSGSAGG